MRMIKLSEHVWSINSPFNIKVWLVKGAEGITLIDAGIPPMAKGILKGIQSLGAGRLNQILLTHGHPDHVGSLDNILSVHPVPVYAHETEIPYMEGQLPYPPFKKPKARVKLSIVNQLPVDADGKLKSLEGLVPYFTPGHSPGHVVYYHEEDRVLIGGDLFMTRFRQLKKPLSFVTANMQQAVKSGSIIMELQPELLSVCHGKEIVRPHEYYEAYRQRWISKEA